MKRLNIQAIFNSIDGEVNGFYGAGQLSTFIRLKNCNLKCSFCDTEYAQSSKPENWMSLDHIANWPNLLKKITITGGEPLLQRENLGILVSQLLDNGHNITIETNGTKFILSEEVDYLHSVRYVVDYKLPTSGMEEYMVEEVFEQLVESDTIKFVIKDEFEYNIAKDLVLHKDWEARKVFSPVIGDPKKILDSGSWSTMLAEKMIHDANDIPDVGYSLQIHKILWPECVGSEIER